MAYVLIQHHAKRLEELETVFKDHGGHRKKMGSKGGTLFQSVDDPEVSFALFEWKDLDKAKEFADGMELHEALEWATSERTAKVWVLDAIVRVDA